MKIYAGGPCRTTEERVFLGLLLASALHGSRKLAVTAAASGAAGTVTHGFPRIRSERRKLQPGLAQQVARNGRSHTRSLNWISIVVVGVELCWLCRWLSQQIAKLS
ncbi:hypothetical protein BO99DRAFT_77435 [Aspergillus violaceofuscus CBS 115571]|uniref:Uncharacterized protein n=1 Tax=Aspergillus violaceofuscus (strain CBS 115571) TaxID=1450538 RepID=A0A2V5HHW1_ASPV1|nr:hypothetical protein BO99DRAFT_77435 [Aspergillus violaceofuscus CBS 115571]